jgi:2-oxoglutarate dehydrogenase E2 component (dihydrolipoamide succinyltransferase)
MKTDVSIPEVGESVTQGILSAWLKKDGEMVSEGEDLFELETDKASLSIPAPASGVLKILVSEGSEVDIGQTVAILEDGKASRDRRQKSLPQETEPSAHEEVTETKKTADETAFHTLSPAVHRLVNQYQLNPDEIRGSGKEGRILKKDVLEIVEQRETPSSSLQMEQGRSSESLEKLRHQPRETDETAHQTRVKMTNIRILTAQRLVASQRDSAHLTTFNEINMERVKQMRTRYREEFENTHGVRLGIISFFVKACCSALASFPEVNAFVEGDEIVYNNSYHIGIAVSTDRGLLVPVIKNADALGLAQIERIIREFSQRAKIKKISLDDLTGGTFTITNGGVFGSLLSTPIPNPPQTAILGMHAIQDRVVVEEGEIVIRPMMYVALTYDHRIIDGKEAVSFLARVKQLVEEPERLLFDV